MKISEMTNEQAAEAMIRIATPLGNICNDQEISDILEEIGEMDKDTNVIVAFGKYIPRIILCAFKTHKTDLYEIISALTMKTVSAVSKMNFKETIQVFKDSYDDIFSNFFTSSGRAKKKIEEE